MSISPSSIIDTLLNDDPDATQWDVVIRDDERVKELLKQGICDGLLADDWFDPDDLLQLTLDMGAFEVFCTLPDTRKRRSIPASHFSKILLAGALPDQRSLRQIGRTVFNSATTLDKLGMNFVMTRKGGKRTGDERPFDVEAMGDYFADLTAAQYSTHALTLASWLCEQSELQGSTWAMDGLDVRVPAGRGCAEDRHFKLIVLSVIIDGRAIPFLWNYCTGKDGEITLAKQLWKNAIKLWGKGACRQLLVDAGFINGPWLKQLHAQGTEVITRIREKMEPFVFAVACVDNDAEQKWEQVPIPKRPKGHERPLQREITGLQEWPGWDTYGQNLAICLVRDTYASGEVDTWCTMSTDPTASALKIYEAFKLRWQIEEIFMALSLYHGINDLPASRIGVACARLQAIFFAYTVRWLCRQRAQQQEDESGVKKPWRRKVNLFILYANGYFAILKASVFMEIILNHLDVWHARKDIILRALRYCEGG
jgi:hypothetical protein